MLRRSVHLTTFFSTEKMWFKEKCHGLTSLSVISVMLRWSAFISLDLPGHIALSVTSLTADPGVATSIPTRSPTLVEIVHEIISTAILLLPLIQEGLLSITSESMCTKYWLTA